MNPKCSQRAAAQVIVNAEPLGPSTYESIGETDDFLCLLSFLLLFSVLLEYCAVEGGVVVTAYQLHDAGPFGVIFPISLSFPLKSTQSDASGLGVMVVSVGFRIVRL